MLHETLITFNGVDKSRADSLEQRRRAYTGQDQQYFQGSYNDCYPD